MLKATQALHRVAGLGASGSRARRPCRQTRYRSEFFYAALNGPDDVVRRSLNCALGRGLLPLVLVWTRVRRLLRTSSG